MRVDECGGAAARQPQQLVSGISRLAKVVGTLPAGATLHSAFGEPADAGARAVPAEVRKAWTHRRE